jgi:hypothetical protein
MNDLGDRLARVLHDAVPEPPHELDPAAIRSIPAHGERRKRLLAAALAAAAVAAVAIGVSLAGHQLAAHPQPGTRGPAVPPPPDKFSAREFRMAPPPQLVIGGITFRRATCMPQQIRATAATRRTGGGVLGVIRFIGAVVSHRDGVAERCTLPIARGPSALIAADGRHLKVPLSSGDRTSRPENPRADIPLTVGKAIWGFAWLGSYCGPPARAIEVPLHYAREGSLRVPLSGPQPPCKPSAGASMLIDGVAGGPGQPVQPPRPEYSNLRLTGQIEPGTTGDQLAPIDLTLRTVGSAPVTLDPCPAYAGRDYGTAHTGGFSAPISTGYLPCTKHAAVIRSGHPLHWTIPATSFMQSGPGSAAIPGSTVYVQLGIAGVPPLRLKTTAGR